MAIKPNSNAYRIIANYILAEVSEEFLACHDFKFINIENVQILLKGLCCGYKQLKAKESDKTYKHHVLFSYVIILIAKYLQNSTEANLAALCDVLFDLNSERIVPFATINKLQYFTCKKISNLTKQNLLSDKFNSYMDAMVHADEMPHYSVDDTLYNDQKFYEDLCKVIKEDIYKKNASLIYEVVSKSDVCCPEDEINMIKRISPFWKSHIKIEQENGDDDNTENVPPEEQMPFPDSENQQHEETEPIASQSGRRKKHTPVKISAALSTNETILNAVCEPMYDQSPVRSVELSLLDKSSTRARRSCRLKGDELRDVVTRKTPDKSKETSNESDLADNEDDLDFNKSISEPIKKTPRRISRLSNLMSNNPTSPETSPKKTNLKLERKSISTKKAKRPTRATAFEVESFDESSDTEVKPKLRGKMSCYSDEDDDKMKIAKPKKKKREWGELESTYLILGIELYGKGNWAVILKKFKLNFNERTSVHLKDRYRTISNSHGLLKRYEKQAMELKKELKISTD